MTRHERKILVVPYLQETERRTKFLIVENRAHQEWTFISGTCEANEKPIACALRELMEETLGLVCVDRFPKTTKRIRLQLPNCRYDVFFVPIRKNYRLWGQIKQLLDQFDLFQDDTSENSGVSVCTFSQFQRKRVWPFLRNHILQHSEFLSVMSTILR